MSIFLVFLAVLVLGLVAVAASGRSLRGRRVPEYGQGGAAVFGSDPGLVEPVASLPAVLLPPQPVATDLHELRFSVGLRGYRMDQVDEVLDSLAVALAMRDEEIARLRKGSVAAGEMAP